MTGGITRLHITPFNPEILRAVVGANLVASVSNLSYHTIQTFPENNYGYLELPTMDAEKVRKKINGAILKGKRMKVEEARPKKRRHVEGPGAEADEMAEEPTVVGTAKKLKKDKKDRTVIPGY